MTTDAHPCTIRRYGITVVAAAAALDDRCKCRCHYSNNFENISISAPSDQTAAATLMCVLVQQRQQPPPADVIDSEESIGKQSASLRQRRY